MGRATILLVEDEPPIRELVADVLRDEGYDVLEAQDGVEALRALDEHSPATDDLSLVVMDIMLPSLDGLGVLRHLGAPVSGPPVVAMSASRHLLSAALAAGARAVLSKPFDLNELLRVVASQCVSYDPGSAPSVAAHTA
jgi:DNA-binding response OmpR family regulator